MFSLPLILQTAAAIISIIVLYSAIRLRSAPKAFYFICMASAVAIYSYGYLFELSSNTLEAAYLATRLQYFAVPFIGPFFYLFVRDYGNRAIRNKVHVACIFIVPLLCCILANGYPYTRLHFSSLSYTLTPSPHLIVHPGPTFVLNFVYNGILLLMGGYEILRHFPKKTAADRLQRFLFLCTLAGPVLNLVFLLGQASVMMDFGPLALCLTALTLGIYIKRNRQVEWLPYAREQVVENLQDAFVLLDNEDRFLDANAKALSYFPSMRLLPAGTPVSAIEGFPFELLHSASPVREFTWQSGDDVRYLRLSTSPIESGSQNICTCVMLYDSTETHRLMIELDRLASHDALTGLLNRGAFFSHAQRVFDLALRHGQPASVLMLDIDHFKRVNDVYGHAAGDLVLEEIARLLPQRLRHTDVCGRYGGEEFCAFLPSTSCEDATTVAENIRRSVQSRIFPVMHTSLHITLSIGVASLRPGEDESLADLVKKADAALYTAKRNGRNRVVSMEALEREQVQSTLAMQTEDMA
ncbi:diguanylate cyclase [Ruminococcaceae bacterium OttesenSCG-928-I18]|nr:diguanylate cyclase [Ruminococcaceae bacterium OttesenSCG-928-I18]